MLHAYNPSRDREVVVNSVFTSSRQFHVSPVHSQVSVDVLLETTSWPSAKPSCFLWPKLLILWGFFCAFFFFLGPPIFFLVLLALFCSFLLRLVREKTFKTYSRKCVLH